MIHLKVWNIKILLTDEYLTEIGGKKCMMDKTESKVNKDDKQGKTESRQDGKQKPVTYSNVKDHKKISR